MGGYSLYTTEEFDKDFSKLDRSLQIQIEKALTQIEGNPYVGKPLGYMFFREKKIEKWRVYYLIYDEYVAVFAIAISDKKDQQETINTIKSLIPYYREEIRKKIKPK